MSDSYNSRQITILKTRLQKFMKIYCRYISQDLYISLRPEFEFDNGMLKVNAGGKETYSLTYIYELFYIILSKKSDTEINPIIDSTAKAIDLYYEESLKDFPENKNSQHTLGCSKYKINQNSLEKFLLNDTNLRLLVYFQRSMGILTQRLNTEHRKISEVMGKFNKILRQDDSESIYYIQSLYEFNNAIAHLYIALKDEDSCNNVEKAMTHLHRGALDNYKNFIQFSNLTDEQKTMLIELRLSEFESIGKKIDEKKKFDILERYMNLTNLIY